MPENKIVKVMRYDGSERDYTIRAFMPMYIRNQVMNIENEMEKGANPNRLEEYLLVEMSLAPTKITKEFLTSEDCDAEEMDRLFEEIMKVCGLWVDPTKLQGLSKEDQTKLILAERQNRINELKKKPTKQSDSRRA